MRFYVLNIKLRWNEVQTQVRQGKIRRLLSQTPSFVLRESGRASSFQWQYSQRPQRSNKILSWRRDSVSPATSANEAFLISTKSGWQHEDAEDALRSWNLLSCSIHRSTYPRRWCNLHGHMVQSSLDSLCALFPNSFQRPDLSAICMPLYVHSGTFDDDWWTWLVPIISQGWMKSSVI